ncbi:MAG: hypothetical protein K2J40_01700 [Ruminococcus sp.]|nr:hypothetical protein [Ruminococcus sp.]
MKKNRISRFIISITAAVCCMTCMINTASPVVLSAEQENNSLMVFEKHTPEEICEYIKNHPSDTNTLSVYTENPSLTVPYSTGKISDETLQNALNSINVIRYICGLQEVTLKNEYNEQCQAAALVNALNGTISHYPARPSGISDELYKIAYNAASSSNLGWNHNNIPSSVLSYMADSGASNISSVGHRRWILNPTMKQTGFGNVGRSYSMYAFDNYSAKATEKGIVWPALNTPVEYFINRPTAWSISIGKAVNISDITVTVTDKDNGQEWKFTENSSDGDFYVNNEYYGQSGCIIFRPDGIKCNAGRLYDVHIEGLSEDISYTVNFFSLKDYETGLLGDINNDGLINAVDSSLVLGEYSSLSTDGTSVLNDAERKAADVNKDSFVDAVDASYILMYYAYVSTETEEIPIDEFINKINAEE